MWAIVIALFSTMAFVVLWFRLVGREMRRTEDLLESAKSQFFSCRSEYLQISEQTEKKMAEKIFRRSEDIYRQARLLYNRTLCKPQNIIPGFILGYRIVAKDNFEHKA